MYVNWRAKFTGPLTYNAISKLGKMGFAVKQTLTSEISGIQLTPTLRVKN